MVVGEVSLLLPARKPFVVQNVTWDEPNPLCAMCGRLRVGKENLHVALLVGAAMCSAYVRG